MCVWMDAWDDDGRRPSVAASTSVCRVVWAVRHARPAWVSDWQEAKPLLVNGD